MSVQETNLKAIADAIREKDGTTEPIPASTFPERIRAISAMPDDVYTITVEADPPEGGSVSGSGVASAGMTVTVKATAASGYKIREWKENGETLSKNADYTFVVEENRALTAVLEKSRLPAGYTELEYIISNSATKIDTGIKPSNALKTSVDIEIVNAESNGIIYFIDSYLYEKPSGSSSYYYTYYQAYYDAGGDMFKFRVGRRPSTVTVAATNFPKIAEKRASIWIDGNKNGSINGKSVSDSNSTLKTIYASTMPNISLFGSQNTVTNRVKCYSAQMYNNNVLVKNFVPCLNPDGKVGVYDLIGGQFYANAVAEYGDFEAGPAI